MTDPVTVSGLKQINQALEKSGPLIRTAMRNGLLESAEPIRQDAGRLSQTEFSGMKRARKKPPPWSIQRKGATQSEVYIVPKQRGNRYRDKAGDITRAQKFVLRMLEKSYDPALERNRSRVKVTVENWIGTVTREI